MQLTIGAAHSTAIIKILYSLSDEYANDQAYIIF